MEHRSTRQYMQGFTPYALAAFLVGIVGGFTTVLGPAFVRDLGLAYNNTTWTALATAMSTAACAPILGRLGDVLGRRTALLLGIAVFTLGNALTAAAPSLLFMLAARFIVGIGSAAIAPVIMSYIIAEFPSSEAAKGFSLYMLISSGAVVFGPAIGGLIIEAAGWRAMMWLCSAICVLIFFLCLGLTERAPSASKVQQRFDGAGAVFVLLFFSLVLCIPSFAQNFGWRSAPFLAVLPAAILSLIGLILTERKAVYPILQGSFLRQKTFILPVLALFLTQGLMQANMTNLIFFVHDTQPQNTVISSYAISIMYLGMSLGAVILGPLADRKEPKLVLTGSLAITGAGCALMLLFTANSSVLLLAAALGLLGFGLGANGTIFMKIVLSGVAAGAAGAGTGTYGLFRDLSAPFGVAVLVPFFTNQVSDRTSAGIAAGLDRLAAASQAAVRSIHTLAAVELLCIILGIAVVRMLPTIRDANARG